jgi:hypothetical protein
MPHAYYPGEKVHKTQTFERLFSTLKPIFPTVTPLGSKGDRPLQMDFESELNALIFFHLEEHASARHLILTLKTDDFARRRIAPEKGIGKSSFSEAINSRGLPQMQEVFQHLLGCAAGLLPDAHPELGELVAIDGSLIEATLSMVWADYRKCSKKAKLHLGFNLNQGIPQSLILTPGKSAEYIYVEKLLKTKQTGVMDRYYQCHAAFDYWQDQERFFACRIKANTTKTVIEEKPIPTDGPVFYDAIVKLGTPTSQTKHQLRLIGYQIGSHTFWIATNRFDLSAQQIVLVYKLRWDIECFFAWWKRHMRVYHLIARSPYGLMMQILAGLITYLLLTIYCHKLFGKSVNIERLRKIRIQIQNELRSTFTEPNPHEFSEWTYSVQAIT